VTAAHEGLEVRMGDENRPGPQNNQALKSTFQLNRRFHSPRQPSYHRELFRSALVQGRPERTAFGRFIRKPAKG
jgi:hypothetical protein